MDQGLLSILVCPECQSSLIYDKQNKMLVCKADKLAYPIIDGVPRMLLEEAQKLTLEEVKHYE
ncbi:MULTISPECIES: Trm112 family protein [Cysteiniphilum]|uniref:Trm112 family protein n=1 Tax=Cysteiniphilum TaxID=2056696 RepID=UPI00177AB433|nr:MULTISPECIES: Trm112 family protein [Cysteiniphilum]